MAPRLKAANLAKTTLASPCSATSTTITVSSSAGFPEPPFRIFVGSERAIYEIMEVTAVNGNTWTVIRGLEGTQAIDWEAGTNVENRFTAGTFLELAKSPHADEHKPGGADPLATGTPASITPGASASEGTAQAFARADHVHATPSQWPPTAHAASHESGGVDALNPSKIGANWDLLINKPNTFPPETHSSSHVPGGIDALPTGSPSSITPGSTSSEGTALSFARSDHVHATPSTWPPSAHAFSHQAGGSDEISVAGLSGELADYQKAKLAIVGTRSSFPAAGIAGRLAYATDENALYRDTGSSWAKVHPTSFLELTDTPSSYSGSAGKVVRVKADETGLEFATSGGGATTFLELTDTPNSYTGQAGNIVRVRSDASGLEFSPFTHGNEAHSPAFVDMETVSRTIYVDSVNGSDTTGDGSQSAPFQTVGKALSTVKQAIADGVTITVHLVGRGASNPYDLPSFGRQCIGSGQVVIEGELTPLASGTVTSGTATTITDSSKNWTTNQFAGKLMALTRGGTTYWRLIESNTSNTLSVIGRLDITPASGDSYVIYDWNSFYSGTGIILWQGNIIIMDLACTNLSSGTLWTIPAVGSSVTFERCLIRASGDSVAILVSGTASKIVISTTLIDGNGYNFWGIHTLYSIGCFQDLSRSWIKSWQIHQACLGGSGGLIYVRYGTILDGGVTVLRVERNAFGRLFPEIVNGDLDSISIRNGTNYGLLVQYNAGCIYTGTPYVNYSGNSTDRSAQSTTYSWYTDE